MIYDAGDYFNTRQRFVKHYSDKPEESENGWTWTSSSNLFNMHPSMLQVIVRNHRPPCFRYCVHIISV
jgi:hypothetical protein